MQQLNNDQSACVSQNKQDGLCDNCLRDLHVLEVANHRLTSEFTIKEVKNFKTGIHFKCDGFIERG